MTHNILTEYFRFRLQLKKYEFDKMFGIIKCSIEKYYDTETGRTVVIGKHIDKLVLIPYEITEESVIPVTIHVITRQQINFRIKPGRLKYE
jgi:hypothetical protein